MFHSQAQNSDEISLKINVFWLVKHFDVIFYIGTQQKMGQYSQGNAYLLSIIKILSRVWYYNWNIMCTVNDISNYGDNY